MYYQAVRIFVREKWTQLNYAEIKGLNAYGVKNMQAA